MRRYGFIVILGQLIVATSAQASGFGLREFSASAMGSAYAGAAATGTDASYLFYNPATLSGVGDFDFSVNATGLLIDSNARYSAATSAGTPVSGNATPHSFIGSAFIPSFALRYRLSDQWAVGFSLTSPWDESTTYPSGWVGRYYALSTNLNTYNGEPIISYQATPDLALAAGAQIQYARSELTEAVDFGTLGALNGIPGSIPGTQDGGATLHGYGWSAGYVLGAMWHATPALSLGVSYRSALRQPLKGREQFTYDTAGIAATINALTGAFTDATGKTGISLPAVVTGGARWDVNDGWTALAGVEYTEWSSFHQLLIQSENPANPTDLTVTNWRNTWFGSLGVEYHPGTRWTFRAGTAVDEGVAPTVTATPRIPDANRYWLSGGVGYRWTDTMDVNFSFSHLFVPQTSIVQTPLTAGNALRGSLSGESNSSANLIGLQLVVR